MPSGKFSSWFFISYSQHFIKVKFFDAVPSNYSGKGLSSKWFSPVLQMYLSMYPPPPLTQTHQHTNRILKRSRCTMHIMIALLDVFYIIPALWTDKRTKMLSLLHRNDFIQGIVDKHIWETAIMTCSMRWDLIWTDGRDKADVTQLGQNGLAVTLRRFSQSIFVIVKLMNGLSGTGRPDAWLQPWLNLTPLVTSK